MPAAPFRMPTGRPLREGTWRSIAHRRAGPVLMVPSTGQVLCQRRLTRGELERDRELPAAPPILSVEVAGGGLGDGRPASPTVALPDLPDLARRCLAGTLRATVDEAIDRLRSAGPASATGCASRGPVLRRHINVFVRGRAGLARHERIEQGCAGRRGSQRSAAADISGPVLAASAPAALSATGGVVRLGVDLVAHTARPRSARRGERSGVGTAWGMGVCSGRPPSGTPPATRRRGRG
jgi:hypothetical protein